MKRALRQRSGGKRTAVTFETVREIARELPGAVEGMSYGTPAFRVGKTLFARQHQDEDSLVIKIDPDERAMRMRADPETFYITEHYRNYPWMLVRFASVTSEDLRELLENAWRQSAPKRLLSDRDSKRANQDKRPAEKR
jgi:hypothetical protein